MFKKFFSKKPKIKPQPDRPVTPPEPIPTSTYKEHVVHGTDITRKKDKKAVFGRHAMESGRKEKKIHGPADWHQYYDTWDDVGTDYQMVPFNAQPFIPHAMRELQRHGIQIQHKLGSGGFGDVYQAHVDFLPIEGKTKTGTDKTLACKTMSLNTYDTRSRAPNKTVRQAMDQLLTESYVHTFASNNPNIVRVEDVFYLYDETSGFPKPIHVLQFMELCEGDLCDLVENNQKLREEHALEWFVQVVSGLMHLHQLNVTHLDIKPHNVMYIRNPQNQEQYLFKLGDFGLAKLFAEGLPAFSPLNAGTRLYLAPEVFHGLGSGAQLDTKAADIYSLGVTFAESMAGMPTQMNLNQAPVVQLLTVIANWDNNLRQQYGISFTVANIIASMTEPDPQYRPYIEEIDSQVPILTQRGHKYTSGQWSEPMQLI